MGRIYPRSIIFVDSQIKRDSKLVNWVKFWPIIFDKTNPLHFDNAETEKIWEIIAENLGTTVPVCKERWRLLLSAYERYQDGYLTIHEVLYRQLKECLTIVCNDIRNEERQVNDTWNTFSEITEEVQSFSLISQQFEHSHLRNSQEGAMSLPLTNLEINFPQDLVNIAEDNSTTNEIIKEMQNTQILADGETTTNIGSPILDITEEQHTCLFLEKCERRI